MVALRDLLQILHGARNDLIQPLPPACDGLEQAGSALSLDRSNRYSWDRRRQEDLASPSERRLAPRDRQRRCIDFDTSWIELGNRLRRLAPNHQLVLVDLDAGNTGGDNILLGNIFCFCRRWRRVQMRLERRYDRGLDLRRRNTRDDARMWCGDSP